VPAAAFATEAVVLRSFRTGEADRVVHLLTPDRGRVAAIAKGARRTTAKMGGRLEPLTRLEVILQPGRGELVVVTGAHVLWSGDAIRREPRLVLAASAGVEAVARLFPEPDPDPALYLGLCRYLEVLGEVDPSTVGAEAHVEAVTLAFVLKLLALAGWRPELRTCTCGSPATAYDAEAGCGRCAGCGGGFPVAQSAIDLGDAMLRGLLGSTGSGTAADRALLARVCRVTAEAHGGVRLALLGRPSGRV